MRLGLPIFQPEKLRDEEFLSALRALDADLGIVIAFRMLPEVVWAMPKLGTFNLHASLLPDYRGAAPINHAIINGDKESGVTTFMLNEKIDQGAIVGQRRVAIGESENVGSLYERMMNIGVDLVVETVDKIAERGIEPIEQQHIEESTLRPAPKIFKGDCQIDWSWSGERIFNFIRGLSPYPAAWSTMTGGKEPITAKIYECEFKPKSNLEIGEIASNNRDIIEVGCSDGSIVIHSLQLSGKKRLSSRDLLLGFKGIEQYKMSYEE